MPLQDRGNRHHRPQDPSGAGITVQIETTRDYDDKFGPVGAGMKDARSDENVKGCPIAV